ncbi:MAG: TonB family protein [Muribaculaceae bacterium]
MGAFIAYTFVAGVFLLASYLVYKSLLANEKQAAFNRATILGLYALSFILPFLRIHSYDAVGTGGIEFGSPTAVVTAGNESSADIVFRILIAIYLIGSVIVTIRTAVTAIRLHRLVASGTHIDNGNYTVVRIAGSKFAPFSWGHYIVISEEESVEDAELIVLHETAHIRCRHYTDLLFAQAVCILLWYNPASWLMLAELKAIHEYQADEAVLASGANVRRYQMLLIKKAVGARSPSLANSLNHSNLKKRITMMYESKAKPVRRLRVLAAVPAVALAAMLLGVPAVSNAVTGLSSSELLPAATVNDAKITKSGKAVQESKPTKSAVEETPDVLPEYPGGISELMKFLMRTVTYPAEAAKNKIQGKVVVGFTVSADGTLSDFKVVKSVNPLLDAEALRAAKAMTVRWKPGRKDGRPVACSFALPVTFKLQ